MRRRLQAIDLKVKAIPEAKRPRVFVELGSSPLYTAGPGSTVDEVITRAGGRNVAADLGKPFATIARETVMAADPGIVIIGTGSVKGEGVAAFAKEPGFDRLAATRSGRVYDHLDPAILFHQNHRLVDGIETLLRLFHGSEAKP